MSGNDLASLPDIESLSPPSSPYLTPTSPTPIPTSVTSTPTSSNAQPKARKRANNADKNDSKSKARFNRDELETILSWLEHLPNFVSVYGAQKTRIGPPLKTSTQAFSTLAAIINKKNKNRLNLNGKNLKERFERHRTLYKKWKDLSTTTGFGATPEDHAKGIYSAPAKLEKNCMCFERMDGLFGRRPDVSPLHEVDSFSASPRLTENAEIAEDGEGSEAEDSALESGDSDGDQQAEDEDLSTTNVVTYRRRRYIQSEEEDEDGGNGGLNETEDRVDEWNGHVELDQDTIGDDDLPPPLNLDLPEDDVAPLEEGENTGQVSTKKRKRKEKRKGPLSIGSSNTQSQKSTIVSAIANSSARRTEGKMSLLYHI
ncbi:hypothetical protein BGZ49_010693 [Haplosporangium sp. Z 27]|nr:hypothetical protein BGZ49_010693 [Haplosporangium sp. Z 27]